MYNKNKKPFTLVELLIVIAIIAILASMLLPALTKAKAYAYTAQCLGNLKQQASAFNMYEGDYSGFFPKARVTVPAAPDYIFDDWQVKLSSYFGYQINVQNKKTWRRKSVFWCNAPVISTPGSTKKANPTDLDNDVFRYGMNFHADLTPNSSTAVAIKRLKKASETFMVMDNYYSNPFMKHYEFFNYAGNIPHNQSANVMFFDCHATTVRYIEIPNNSNSIFWTPQMH